MLILSSVCTVQQALQKPWGWLENESWDANKSVPPVCFSVENTENLSWSAHTANCNAVRGLEGKMCYSGEK